jgi:cytochrome c oxidase cbb3-type subunit 1
MWVAGIMQGLMWRSYTEYGLLEYSFVEAVQAMHPYYIIRALGGLLYLAGALIMVYNFVRTIKSKELNNSVSVEQNQQIGEVAYAR